MDFTVDKTIANFIEPPPKKLETISRTMKGYSNKSKYKDKRRKLGPIMKRKSQRKVKKSK